MENGKQTDDLTAEEKISQDLARLFDYPSVGELFATADTRRFEDFCGKLEQTRENLERIVRYGSREESERATRAVRAVQVTLEFLENLQQMRQNSGR